MDSIKMIFSSIFSFIEWKWIPFHSDSPTSPTRLTPVPSSDCWRLLNDHKCVNSSVLFHDLNYEVIPNGEWKLGCGRISGSLQMTLDYAEERCLQLFRLCEWTSRLSKRLTNSKSCPSLLPFCHVTSHVCLWMAQKMQDSPWVKAFAIRDERHCMVWATLRPSADDTPIPNGFLN